MYRAKESPIQRPSVPRKKPNGFSGSKTGQNNKFGAKSQVFATAFYLWLQMRNWSNFRPLDFALSVWRMRLRLWPALYSLLILALFAIPANADAWAATGGNAIDAQYGSYQLSAPSNDNILRADASARLAGLKSERWGEADGPLPGLPPEENPLKSTQTAISNWYPAPPDPALRDRVKTSGPRAPPAI